MNGTPWRKPGLAPFGPSKAVEEPHVPKPWSALDLGRLPATVDVEGVGQHLWRRRPGSSMRSEPLTGGPARRPNPCRGGAGKSSGTR